MLNPHLSIHEYERVPSVDGHVVQLAPTGYDYHGLPGLPQQPASRASTNYRSIQGPNRHTVLNRCASHHFSWDPTPVDRHVELANLTGDLSLHSVGSPKSDSRAVSHNSGYGVVKSSSQPNKETSCRHGSDALPSLQPGRDRVQSLPSGVSVRRPTHSSTPLGAMAEDHAYMDRLRLRAETDNTDSLLKSAVAAYPQSLPGSAPGACGAIQMHTFASQHDLPHDSRHDSAYDVERAQRRKKERSLDHGVNTRPRTRLPAQEGLRADSPMPFADERLASTSDLPSIEPVQERQDMVVEHALGRVRTYSLDVNEIHALAGATLDNRGGREMNL